MWFECKIRYEKMSESGVMKKVTETYLVEGACHAEAETRFAKEMQAYISGENEIISIRRVKIAELLLSDVANTWWWKARVSFIVTDKHGAERRTGVTMLVQGDGIGDAVKTFYEGMKDTMQDYEVVGLTKTNIEDVITDGKA